MDMVAMGMTIMDMAEKRDIMTIPLTGTMTIPHMDMGLHIEAHRSCRGAASRFLLDLPTA